jgi:hypothetical protein
MVVWMLIFKRDWYHVSFALILNVIILLKLSPDIIDYLKYNKDGGVDYSSIMDQTGMGRGMKKIMKFLGIKPDK